MPPIVTSRLIFITGTTGYLGRALVPALIARGHRVRALARETSRHRVPAGAEVITGMPSTPRAFPARLRRPTPSCT